MRTFGVLGLSLALGLGWAAEACGCDIGPFPDNPAETKADVIALGHVESVVEVPGAPGYSRTAGARITIDAVPVGTTNLKTYALKWPPGWPGDCIYPTGPYLRQGDRVALYLDMASGTPRIVDWFLQQQAVNVDPRLIIKDAGN